MFKDKNAETGQVSHEVLLQPLLLTRNTFKKYFIFTADYDQELTYWVIGVSGHTLVSCVSTVKNLNTQLIAKLISNKKCDDTFCQLLRLGNITV